MHEADDGSNPANRITCPQCGAMVADNEAGLNLNCQNCGTQFLQPSSPLDYAAPQSSLTLSGIPGDPDSDSELSGLRIRNITHMRRGAARTRSYFIIGAGGCLMLAAELIPQIFYTLRAIGRSRLMMDMIAVGAEALVVLASTAGAAFFIRKTIDLTRELHQSLLGEPDKPPDFSILSDGSQHVRDLEQMLGKDDQEL